MNSETMRATLRVTKALADGQRVRILMMLEPGELCVCQIVEVLGLAPSTVSKHLSILAEADLVVLRKTGRWAYYRLPNPAEESISQPVLDWLSDSLQKDRQIQQDREVLASVIACDPESLCRRQRIGSPQAGAPRTPPSPPPSPQGGTPLAQPLSPLPFSSTLPQRRRLPHTPPDWVPQSARFFISINCRQKGKNTLCQDRLAQALMASAQYYEEAGRWYLWLLLLMPDHMHLIASFGPEHGLRSVVNQWKRYQAGPHGIDWQSNFFDHRLRSQDEFNEKAYDIRMNPVRKELVPTCEEWPFVLDRTSGVLGAPALPGDERCGQGRG